MEHFDISKGSSGLFMPIDDNIHQWTSLYNTRMHYRMLADQQRQQANKQKAGDMVKGLDQVLAVTANPIFDGSMDNKLINDTIGKYRNYIIDAKSGLLAGDMSYLEDAANLLSQFSKDLDPNGNAIKTLGKQNYLVSQIQKIKDRVKDTNLYNLDASKEVDATINQLINKYNNNEINIDQLTQGINSIDDRNFRNLKQFIDEAEKISQDEWDRLSPDNMWKLNTKSINQNKAASLLLRAVNYAGGTDADLFNFYKVVKGSKGEKKKQYLTQEEYNKLIQANKSATDDKQRVEVGADIKTDIRECTTIACRRVLGEVYPVIKGTSSTRSETKLHESILNRDEYDHQINANKDYKFWETQLGTVTAKLQALQKAMENANLSAQERSNLMVQFDVERSIVQQMFRGNRAIETESIPVSIPYNKQDFEKDVNNPNYIPRNPVAKDVITKLREKGSLLVDINDTEGTVKAITDNIIKFHKDYYDKLNAKGKAEDAIRLVVLEGIKEANKQGFKGNNGFINFTQLLKLGKNAKIDNLISETDSNIDRENDADYYLHGLGATPITLGWNNIGAHIEESNKKDFEQEFNTIRNLSEYTGTENAQFARLSDPGSNATVMNNMNRNGALFISRSTIEGDKPITLQDKPVLAILGYAVSKSGKPLFNVQYMDKDGSVKNDIFSFNSMQSGNLINSINSNKRTNTISFPNVTSGADNKDMQNYTEAQTDVFSELDNIPGYIQDYNKHKHKHNNNNNEDHNINTDYSYDIPYGNNKIKITMLKDAKGNFTNQYIASTIINGSNIYIRLRTDDPIEKRNKLVHDKLLSLKGYKQLSQKSKK